MDVETDWGSSGLAWLTGTASGPPDFSRAAVLARARDVASRFQTLTGVILDAGALLAGRAALLGLSRNGRASAGGGTRLLRTADGWCAVTLARPEDLDAVPALVSGDASPDPWATVTGWAAAQCTAAVVERAGLLDIPAATLGETPAAPPRIERTGPRQPRPLGETLVVDMTSMWAGPLCGRLLAQAGATVVKVESPARPDGTRAGPKGFFDWVNTGKLSCTVDFGRDAAFLRDLLSVADVVLEGSRPAAFARRGLTPQTLPARPGRVWARITAHGTDQQSRTGFGDDAAVAGGLVGGGTGSPVFCADAIADPLTGLEAAVAVAEATRRGGGEVITLSLAAVAARYAAPPVSACVSPCPAPAPRRPEVEGTGPALGRHDDRVRSLVSERTP